ncbi:MAG TPA: hypothetical protein VF226_21735 [Hyphomicrobiaceae bacterium]
MKRTAVFAIAGAVFGVGVAVSGVQAAPSALSDLMGATNSQSLVEEVHGRHRACVRWRGWWHRHVGWRNRTVACGPRWRRYRHCFWDRRGRRVCVWRRR